jgi:penicillin-binding protein 1A
MARVLFKTILMGDKSAGGGSTITQQLAKNLFSRKDYGIVSLPVNKVREHIIALRLEKVYTKEEILSLYVNTVSFGENTYGLSTASKRFFDKHPATLTVEEAAMLIGMLKGPSLYNPRTNHDNSIQRRNTVISQMAKYGHLNEQQIDSIQSIPIKLNYQTYTGHSGLAPYFREFLRQKLRGILDEIESNTRENYNLYTSGLKIYTTIDSRLQSYAETSIRRHMAKLQKLFHKSWNNDFPWQKDEQLIKFIMNKSSHYQLLKQDGVADDHIAEEFEKPINMNVFSWDGIKNNKMSRLDSIRYYLNFLHAGLFAMSPENGHVFAWVGGIDFKHFKYDHVVSERQAGSVFKPVVYATALENGFTPCQFVSNDTAVFTSYNNWQPRNSDRQYGGYYSLKGALTNSVNTVAARLIMQTGIENVVQTATNLGIEGEFNYVPSLALGTQEVSLLEMVRAYTAFANHGQIVEPVYIQRIEDNEGNIIFKNDGVTYGKRAFGPETSEKLLQMMRFVISQGTGVRIRTQFDVKGDLAGKTGTTQNQSDGWFIGLTPKIAVGAWVGGEYPMVRFPNLTYGQGAATALPLVGQLLEKAYDHPEFSSWENEFFRFQHIEDFADVFGCPDYQEELRERKLDPIFKLFKRDDEKEPVKDIISSIKNIFGNDKKDEDKKEERKRRR